MQRVAIAIAVLLCTHAGVRAAEPYEKVANIAYLGAAADTDYAKEQCRLDVYKPVGKKGYATIVWFHGGGLKGGDRNSGLAFARRFTSEGFGVVLVGYRFSPKVKCPVYIEDAAASVAWTIKHIAVHDGDPKKVFVSGHSAGGYLTAIIGMDKRYLAKHDLSTDAIAGCMPVAGQMITHSTIRGERGMDERQPLIDEYAPAYHARKDAPPFICFAGDRDMIARAEENLYFTAVMKGTGHKRVECVIAKDRDHGSVAGKFNDPKDEVSLAMLRFMKGIVEDQ